jgi:hypothetical protein
MSRTSGNWFPSGQTRSVGSEIVLEQGYEIMIRFNPIGSWSDCQGLRSGLNPRLCSLGAAYPIADIDQRDDRGTFDRDAGQASRREGAGVDIDPI